MDYKGFLNYLENCRELWRVFSKSFESETVNAYLKKSYPVLYCAPWQIPLDDAKPYSMAVLSPNFLKSNRHLSEYIRLIRNYEDAKKASGDSLSDKKLSDLSDKLKKYDLNQLEFQEYTLEIRFPTMKMGLIQEIKKSPLVDKEKTDTSMASIRVVLKV